MPTMLAAKCALSPSVLEEAGDELTIGGPCSRSLIGSVQADVKKAVIFVLSVSRWSSVHFTRGAGNLPT